MSAFGGIVLQNSAFLYERGRVASLIARLFALRLTELRHD